MAGRSRDDVRLLATADVKRNERGLWEAADTLQLPLRLISSDDIRRCPYAFEPSPLAEEKVGLPAVAEPAALLAGRRTRFLLRRQILDGVTVAIAEEDFLS